MVDLAAPFNALIQSNQASPPNPLAAVGQMAQTQQQVTQADDAALANAQNHVGYIINGMTPLLAKGANVTANDVATAGANLVTETKGRISPQEIAHFIGQLPTDGGGIQSALQQHLLRLQGANDRISTLRGAQVETQTGGGTQFGTRNSFTGAYQPQKSGGYVPNQPGVGLTEGPSINTPSGPQATRITNQQAYDIASGRARVENGRIVYGAPGGPNTPGPDGKLPVAAVGPAGGALLPVGAPSGAAGAADVASQGSAHQGLDLQRAADQVPQTQATIANMQSMLDKFSSGPMAGRINQGKKIVNQAGEMIGAGDVFDPKTVAAQEEFHKQAEMLAQQSFTALGGTGSDKQLSSAHGSNPNDTLSSLGNREILPMLAGLQDAVQAKNTAWQTYRQQHGDASYGQFSDDFNKSFSPRAFMFVRMSPSQRQDLVHSMNPAERAQLGGALANAEQRGWIKPNGQ